MKLVWLALLCACGKAEDKAAPVPQGLPRLKVSIGEKLVPMTKAFIAHRADGAFRVLVSDRDGSCGELLTNTVNRSRDAITLVATIAAQLDPQGTPHYTALDVTTGAAPVVPHKLAAAFVGTTAAAPGKTTPVQLELLEDEVGLGVAGGFDAEGCGELELSGQGLPKAAHASTGIMWVATKKFPIQGALRRGDAILLSDLPKDCSATTAAVGVRLVRDGGKWTLDGARLPVNVVGEAPKLTVTAGATGTSADGPTVQLALGGSDKLGDYPVGLEGTVEALDCK